MPQQVFKRFRVGLIFCFSCFFTALFSLYLCNYAPAAQPKARVVMVIFDRLSLDDLTNPATGNLSRLIRRGSVGLLNTGTGGVRNPESTYATIGAGAHAVATKAGAFAYEPREQFSQNLKVYEEFEQRTGLSVLTENVVVLEIARLVRANALLPYPVIPGSLGEQLKTIGLETGCLGNADWRDRLGRQVATVAMDENGVVGLGYVGRELLARDRLFPGGFRTDYDVLWQYWQTLKKKADFIVIDLGDTSRLDEAHEEITDAVFQKHWQDSLEKADRFVGKLAADLDLRRSDVLFIVSPTPSHAALEKGDWLTPVVAVGSGVTPGTVLTSPSTRRPGIIMNTDLAPAVLHIFNIKIPVTMSGRPVEFAKVADPMGYTMNLRRQTLFVHNIRAALIKTYLVYVLILLVASVLFMLLREQHLATRLRLYPLLLSVLGFPSACILVPLLGTPSLAAYVTGLAAITAALTMITIIFEQRRPLAGFIFISLATIGLIISDTVAGSVLLRQSILSYDPIGGARFYGIGNEYMGVLISAAIFGGACALSIWSRRVTLPAIAVLWVLIAFVLGAPGLGANFGGLLTAVVAFPVTFLAFCRVKLSWRVVVLIVAILALIPVSFAVIDLLRGQGTQSHVGRSFLLAVHDPAIVYDIISRKMAMNFKLFRYTIWSRVLAVGVGGLLLLFYRPVGVMRIFRSRYPYLFTGFVGVVVTVAAAFLFNDSGTVAAATATIFGIPPLFYIFLKES